MHWRARREISGWLLSFLNKLMEFKHVLAPSAQLLLPGFSCGRNNNKTFYCGGECCFQCHRITAFTHHKNNMTLIWIQGGLQGWNISKSFDLFGLGVFWLVSHAKNPSPQKRGVPSVSGTASHPPSGSEDCRECAE